jgi:hypothetical protein
VFDRQQLRIGFTIFDGPVTDGAVLAHVEGFYPLPPSGRRLAPSSKLARVFQLLPGADGHSVSTALLRNRLWRVQVETVTHDRFKKPMPAELHYSKIGDVLAWIDEGTPAG